MSMNLDQRRRAEFPQYERPEYFGHMKAWRVAIVSEWIGPLADRYKSWLDVGCGIAETRSLAQAYRMDWRGCEVVQSCCNRPDVRLIPGAHDLGCFRRSQFDVVTCLDVLEHVLEEDIPDALREIARVASRKILLGISGCPGQFHPTVHPAEWWLQQIGSSGANAARLVFDGRAPESKRPYYWIEVDA